MEIVSVDLTGKSNLARKNPKDNTSTTAVETTDDGENSLPSNGETLIRRVLKTVRMALPRWTLMRKK